MKTITLLCLLCTALGSAAVGATYRMPGQRKPEGAPNIPVNPFVNSAQEVANAANKQEQIPPSKIFEQQLAKTSVSGLFWHTDPSQRSVLLSGFILHPGDSFPREIWEGGPAFRVKSIEVNRIAFAVPGSPDEVIYKPFELLNATPRRANGKVAVALDPTGVDPTAAAKPAAPAGAPVTPVKK